MYAYQSYSPVNQQLRQLCCLAIALGSSSVAVAQTSGALAPPQTTTCHVDAQEIACDTPCKGRKTDIIVTRRISNGNLMDQSREELSCRNGQRDGRSKVYYRSGKLQAERVYSADQLHGVETTFFDDGKHWSTTLYDHGQIVWLEQYVKFENVGIVSDRRERDPKNPTDSALTVQTYRKGKEPLNGRFTRRHTQAPGWMEFDLKDGHYDGEYFEYNGKGILTRHLRFHNGKQTADLLPPSPNVGVKGLQGPADNGHAD